MSGWDLFADQRNLMSLLIAVVFAASVVQGAAKGASGSARQLVGLIAEGVATAASLLLAWRLMSFASPLVRDWLISLHIELPQGEIGPLRQAYYTLVTGMRDFSLMRSGILFLIGYGLIKHALAALAFPLVFGRFGAGDGERRNSRTLASTAFGAIFGAATGTGRALMLIAALFVYTALFPLSPFTQYVQQSALYQKGAKEVIEPFAGELIAAKLPVFTRAVEEEFANILRRKYEVLDARVPDDIAAAAKEITAGKQTDEDKAKALYQWVGTRIKYDWDKVRLYEEKRIWKEQTPEDTFRSRKGVCIDYSRLYAVMARAVGLDAKVVTGLGYDGRGGFGPHAWNEVYLAQQDKWIPLDSTWVASGGNWFNPANFYETHVKEA